MLSSGLEKVWIAIDFRASRPKVNWASVIVFSISLFLETKTANYVN